MSRIPVGPEPVLDARLRRLAGASLTLVGAIVVGWFFLLGSHGWGYDAFAYWDVDLDAIYGRSFGQLTGLGAFRYSPPIAYLSAPLSLIPWPIFLVGWTVLLSLVLVWMTGRWALSACAFIGVPMSIYQGNIDLLVAASIVLGFRWPAAWSFAILSKATPVIGLAWYAVRGEWRSLAIAAMATLLIAAPTLLLVPDAWREYAAMLGDNSTADEGFLLPIRLLIGIGLTVAAARRNRAWLVGFAVAIAQPTLGLRSAAVGVAALGLALRSSGQSASGTRPWSVTVRRT